VTRTKKILYLALLALFLLFEKSASASCDSNYLLKWGSLGTGNGQFNGPDGTAVDASGDVYVVEDINSRIQKFDANGNYLGQFGSSGTGNGQLSHPLDIQIDAAGNLYVVDWGNNRIEKFDSSGTYLTQWGTLGSGNGQFSEPWRIALDGAGHLYITDHANQRVQEFTTAGVYVTQWGGFGSGNGQFKGPEGMGVDASGHVFVVDSGNNRVEEFDASGTYLAQWGTLGSGNGQFNFPEVLAVAPNGDIYVSDENNARIQKFDNSGSYLLQWGSAGSGNGQFNDPESLALDAAGDVYVADYSNNRVEKFGCAPTPTPTASPTPSATPTPTVTSVSACVPGHIQNFAGSGVFGPIVDGGPAASSELYFPWGVATDVLGNVYIGDASSYTIRRVDSSGIIHAFAGTGTPGTAGDGGPAAAAQLNGVAEMTMDTAGNLYYADYTANKVRKIDAAGIITTVAGTGTAGFSGDGGPATAAKLNAPYGVAVDPGGNLYIADETNSRIRKVDPAGVITTFAGTGTAGFSGDGGPSIAAQINHPIAIASDANGNIYIADINNDRVRKVDAAGTITTFAGTGTVGYSGDGGPATFADLNHPYGLIADTAGNVYISDSAGSRVRRVDTSGIITTVAGDGTAATSGDGGPATAAALIYPRGLALDTAGDLYVSDGGGHVREVCGVGDMTAPTATPSRTMTSTPTPSPSASPSSTLSATPSSTATFTATASPTSTATSTSVSTSTPTVTATWFPSDAGKVLVYPQPAAGGLLTFSYVMAGPGMAHIAVFTERGDLAAKIEEHKLSGPQNSKLSLDSFAAGVYFYQVLLNYDLLVPHRFAPGKFVRVR
jgi:sugar lactone lactonase YvrE